MAQSAPYPEAVDQVSRTRKVVLTALFLAFVGLQIAIPISRLGSGQSVRFGWQMFSTGASAPEITVVTPNGEMVIDLDEYMTFPRGDLDIVGNLPRHLCAVIPEATAVLIGEAAVVPCP